MCRQGDSKMEYIKDIYEYSNCEGAYKSIDGLDNAIIGYTIDQEGEFHIVYDEDDLIEEISINYGCSYEEALDIYMHDSEQWLSGEGADFIVIKKI